MFQFAKLVSGRWVGSKVHIQKNSVALQEELYSWGSEISSVQKLARTKMDPGNCPICNMNILQISPGTDFFPNNKQQNLTTITHK